MERLRVLRNIAIVALIAAAVQFLPGAGRAAESFAAALWVVLGAGVGYFAYRYYREHRLSLYSLGDRYRLLLYGALGLACFTAVAQPRMWSTGVGELVWFVLLAIVVYALLVVYRFSRTY